MKSRRKRILIFIIALMLILSLAGCGGGSIREVTPDWPGLSVTASNDPQTPPSTGAQPDTSGSSEYDVPENTGEPFNFDEAAMIPIENVIEYYHLTPEEKRLYDQLSAGIANLDLIIEVDWLPQDHTSLRRASMPVLHTHPEFFWWRGAMFLQPGFKPTADGKYYIAPTYTMSGRDVGASFDGAGNPDFWPSEEEYAALMSWVEDGKAAIHGALNELPVNTGMTAYELELAVHDWLCARITFEAGGPDQKSMYGGMVTGRTDCSGYTHSFNYILRLLGIECLFVGGKNSVGEDHGWSAVKLDDGEWYLTDASSNDGRIDAIAETLPWHLYFNRSSQSFLDCGYTFINSFGDRYADITCTATQYNYYNMTGAYIASDADLKTKGLACYEKAKANGERLFELEIAPFYAAPSEVYEKLITSGAYSEYSGTIFYYYESSGLVIGVLP